MTHDPRTGIAPDRLRAIREEGYAQAQRGGSFVDPRAVNRGVTVLRHRGEEWAQAVLGRRFDRRSLWDARVPWLNSGEFEALVIADREEDDATFTVIVSDH